MPKPPHILDRLVLTYAADGTIWRFDSGRPTKVGWLDRDFAPVAAAGPLFYRLTGELVPFLEQLLKEADANPAQAADAKNLQEILAAIDYARNYSKGKA